MTRSLLVTLAFLAALAPTLSAQTLGASWTRTFFGCDANRSCHRVVFEMRPGPNPPPGFPYQVGTVHWWGWFFLPGAVHNIRPRPFNGFLPEFGPSYADFRWYHEEIFDPIFISGSSWRPTAVDMTIVYGPLGHQIGSQPNETASNIRLTLTPEPASLLLLATGLGALAGARRRVGKGRRI